MKTGSQEDKKTHLSPIKGFFLGRLLEESLLPLKDHPSEEKENLELILESLEKFMSGKHEDFVKFDREGYQSDEFILALKELGLFGLIIPEEYEGLGLSSRGYARVLQQVTRHDGSTALTIGAHSSIGMKALLLFGNDVQKGKYLPKLATGEMIAAFCLTESGAGSDAASLRTKADKQDDGSWLLSGEKIWITNGPIAQFYTVFARTGDDSSKGISAFIVERDWAGVTTGPKEDKLGIRGSATCTVAFDNVRIPPEALLGQEGQGFRIAVAVLNNGRTGLGGGCVGAMKRCIQLSIAQANERRQFGKLIGEFGLIRKKITQMAMLCYASESVVQMVGQYIDDEVEDYSIEAAAAKIFTSESLWTCAYEALQIGGGNGFMKEFPFEVITRDARINTIFEGTNEILRLFIGLRAIDELGRYLKEIQSSISDFFDSPQEGIGAISKYVMNKIGQYAPISSAAPEEIHPTFHHHSKVLGGLIKSLARTSETLLHRYGRDIKDKQITVARLAEVAVLIFSGYCTLARASREKQPNEETRQLVTLFTDYVERLSTEKLQLALKNDEGMIEALGKALLEKGEFPWDVTMD